MSAADIIAGIDMVEERLVLRDCFSERTLRLLDELRAEVLGSSERGSGVVCACGKSFQAEGTLHGQPAALWNLLGHRASGCSGEVRQILEV